MGCFILLAIVAAPALYTGAQEAGPSGLIAYIRYTDTNGDGVIDPVADNGTLWVIDAACASAPETCEGANLTDDDTDERDPAWSPDGARIVYTSSDDMNQDGFINSSDFANLYTIAPADGTITRVTNSFTIDTDASWSPDGSRMTFQAIADTDDDTRLTFADLPGVNVINAGGGGRTLRTLGEYALTPKWSPNGTALAFVAFADDAPADAQVTSLFLISPDTGGSVQITPASSLDRMPAWAPGGNRLAFVTTTDTNLDGDIDPLSDINSVAVVNRDGGGLTRLAECDPFAGSIAWSPDGTRVAYTFQGALYVVPAGGGSPLQLTGEGFDADEPVWSPDGAYIAFTSGNRLYVITAAGGQPSVPLTDEAGYVAQPAWAPLPEEEEVTPTPEQAPIEPAPTETTEAPTEEGAPAVEPTVTPAGLAPADNIPTPTPTQEGRG
jgi:Tol biopolymer transport system component